MGLEVTITIRADPATLTPANLDKLERAIFAQSAKLDDVPGYWRDFMAHGERDPKKDATDANNKGEIIAGLQSNYPSSVSAMA